MHPEVWAAAGLASNNKKTRMRVIAVFPFSRPAKYRLSRLRACIHKLAVELGMPLVTLEYKIFSHQWEGYCNEALLRNQWHS